MNKTKAMERILFTRGVPAPETLPAKKIADSCSAILQEDGSTILQYYSAQGYAPLRKLLAEKAGNNATKDQILIGNGSLQILDIIAHVLVNIGETVLVERPTYDRAVTVFSRSGAEVLGVPLKEDGIDLKVFRKLVEEENPRVLYIIPDFQNPTGITTSEEKRRKIIAIAEEHDLLVVENTLYKNLRYYGEDIPTFWELNSNLVLHLSSFSKVLSPGLRVGWVATNAKLMESISQYAEDTYITSNMLSQGIIYKLMEEQWIEENIKDLRELYSRRLDVTLESLRKHLPEAKWVEPKGGFFVGVWLPSATDMKTIYRKSKERGLILSESNGFFPDSQPHGFVRIPFCALNSEEIKEGIKRLANAFKDV